MAAERTYFAWLRTGLQAIGVSLTVGRVIPALIDTSNVAYVLLGLGYGVLGGFLVCYALVRARQLETAPRCRPRPARATRSSRPRGRRARSRDRRRGSRS